VGWVGCGMAMLFVSQLFNDKLLLYKLSLPEELKAGNVALGAVNAGLGRIVASHDRTSALYQIR
jgi:hypothetical protein